QFFLCVVRLALLGRLDTLLICLAGVLGGHGGSRADGESFYIAQPVQHDRPDVGVIHVPSSRERNHVGSEAWQLGTQLAIDQLAFANSAAHWVAGGHPGSSRSLAGV